MAVVDTTLRMRRAQPDEAGLLNALIARSKAHWGYDAVLLEAWLPDLMLDPDTIARDPVYCAEDAASREIVGVSHCYRLNDEEVYLDRLFVEPAYIGGGVGSTLWRHVVELARTERARAVVLDADPNALPFYERMGAVIVDWKDSTIVPGRRIPQMRFQRPSC